MNRQKSLSSQPYTIDVIPHALQHANRCQEKWEPNARQDVRSTSERGFPSDNASKENVVLRRCGIQKLAGTAYQTDFRISKAALHAALSTE